MSEPPGNFITGDPVEVICQDKGFRGAIYEARIVRWMPRLDRYTVEYETLVDGSKPPKKLREAFDGAHVRPRPPHRPLAASEVEIGRMVDAFYNEGWWVGELSKLSEGGERIWVVFRESREEIEFGLEEVRVHLDWIGGEWVLPQVEGLLNILKKGAAVEVNSDEEGFRGAWFCATLIESDGKDFLVEYRDFTTDDETAPLRATVDSIHIRPLPPNTPAVEEFNKFEEVDAFHNDGWWVGVVSKVLDGQRYMVYFKAPYNEELEFGHNDLRLHQEWIGGKWQRASQVLGL